MNIAEILTKTSERLPNKMAFYFDDRGTTYQALQDGSESLALGLKKLGVQKGDRVGVFSPSSLEFVISWFAASLLPSLRTNPFKKFNRHRP
jgi:fatty-acyl-CoA synthase